VGLSVVRILLDRDGEILDGFLQTISGALVPEVATLEIGLISFRIHYWRLFQRGLFLFVQNGLDLLGNGARDRVLKRQRVPQISFIAMGPNMPVGRHLDQLS